MNNLVFRNRKVIVLGAITVMMVLATAQAAFATSVHYTFYQNVPRYGFVNSSNKTLPNNTAFQTRLDTCTANDGSGEGAKGIYFRAYRASNHTVIKNTPDVKPGSGYKTLINAVSTGSRVVYIGLQAEGTSACTAAGYWYY